MMSIASSIVFGDLQQFSSRNVDKDGWLLDVTREHKVVQPPDPAQATLAVFQ